MKKYEKRFSSAGTRLFEPADIESIIELLSGGGIVGLPSETVYGLAADATNELAVQKIFLAKERPVTNPLIVHCSSVEQLLAYASVDHQWVYDCLAAFCPGPLSFVLPLRRPLACGVTAGLSTVAFRMPSQTTFREILLQSGLVLAAPSANRSGKPSGTSWQAVLHDLDGRMDGLVCDVACQWGLESTVIDATTDRPVLLRAGAITLEALQKIAPNAAVDTNHELAARSPGTRFRHYQPTASVVLFDRLDELPTSTSAKAFGLICASTFHFESSLRDRYHLIETFDSLDSYANKLFDFFRRADSAGVSEIHCQRVSQSGLGLAIMDRLLRASQAEQLED